MVPTATASSRKISGAVEMIHLTVSMVAIPRGPSIDASSVPGTG
jgi:hypothetical protein